VDLQPNSGIAYSITCKFIQPTVICQDMDM